MKTHKFKVGDTVMRTTSGHYNGGPAGDDFNAYVGQIGVIEKVITDFDDLRYRVNNYCIWMEEYICEPTKLHKILE